MWPFTDGDPVQSLSNFINSLLSTTAADMQTALNIATAQNDEIGINAYTKLLALRDSLLKELGLSPGATVGPAAIAELLHVFAKNSAMQDQIKTQVELAVAPLVQRTITDAGAFAAFLAQAASAANLVAPVALPAA